MYKTKKAAREAGFWGENDLKKRRLIPSRDAEPTLVKGEAFFHLSQCEDVIHRTEAKRRGLSVPSTAVPAQELHWYHNGRWHYTDGFRISDCPDRRSRREIPAVLIDLLAAIFAVNRAAKRYRNAASTHYRVKQHGFARVARERKERLYELKDAGIAAAFRQGLIWFAGMDGNLALYRGEGYCFHSTLIPKNVSVPNGAPTTPIYKEAVRREASEARLKDAIKTLEELPDYHFEDFQLVAAPRHTKELMLSSRARNDEEWDSPDFGPRNSQGDFSDEDEFEEDEDEWDDC